MSEANSKQAAPSPNEVPQALLEQEAITQQVELDLEVAKANLDLVIGWIGHADSKATFYLTVAIAMLGASFTELPALVRVCEHFASTEQWTLPAILIVCHLAFYGASLLSAYHSIGVVKPRLAPDSKTHSWYFFQSIATFEDVNKWRQFSQGLKCTDRLLHLVDQIWNVSRVAVTKFKAAATADLYLRVAFCFGTVSVVVTLVIDELTR